jgi:hypothetical protein
VIAIRPYAAWADCWVGIRWDARLRRLYVLPLPMLGLVVHVAQPCEFCGAPTYRPSGLCETCYYGICASCPF